MNKKIKGNWLLKSRDLTLSIRSVDARKRSLSREKGKCYGRTYKIMETYISCY